MANPELRRDSTETDWVRHLQELLQTALGNSGTQLSAVDGLFGPITEASVIYFQQQNGLPADGIVGDATWAVRGRDIVELDTGNDDPDPRRTDDVADAAARSQRAVVTPHPLARHDPESIDARSRQLLRPHHAQHPVPVPDAGGQVVRYGRYRGPAPRGAVVAELVRRLEHEGDDRLVEDCGSAHPEAVAIPLALDQVVVAVAVASSVGQSSRSTTQRQSMPISPGARIGFDDSSAKVKPSRRGTAPLAVLALS